MCSGTFKCGSVGDKYLGGMHCRRNGDVGLMITTADRFAYTEDSVFWPAGCFYRLSG